MAKAIAQGQHALPSRRHEDEDFPKRAVRASHADRQAATAAGQAVAVVEQQRWAWLAAN